jgi:hypothetical protein
VVAARGAAAAAAAAGVPPWAAAAVLTAVGPAGVAARMPFWAQAPAAVAAVEGRVSWLTPNQPRALAAPPSRNCSQEAQLHVVAAACTSAAAGRAQPAVQVVRALRSLLQAALLSEVLLSLHFETLAKCFAKRADCSSSLRLVGHQAKQSEARSNT